VKILVTGSDGFSGSNFCLQAMKDGHQVLGTDLACWFAPKGCRTERLDIRDQQSCNDICKSFHPDVIIHTARAPGNLWQIERDRATTYGINVLGTRNLAQCAEELGALFVFLSTDWIFNGSKPVGEKYEEDEDACPLCYYGVTKWVAEQTIVRTVSRWLILRTAHIYGMHGAVLETPYQKGMNIFRNTVWAGIWDAILKGKEIFIPDNMYQTPVLVNNLVEKTLLLLGRAETGVFHVTDRDCLSRYETVRDLFSRFGIDGSQIKKGTSMDFAREQGIPPELESILPLNSCLNVSKIEKKLGIKMPTFTEGLEKLMVMLNGLNIDPSRLG
jgi:dTDP-4-dehydrorhamnose reductase